MHDQNDDFTPFFSFENKTALINDFTTQFALSRVYYRHGKNEHFSHPLSLSRVDSEKQKSGCDILVSKHTPSPISEFIRNVFNTLKNFEDDAENTIRIKDINELIYLLEMKSDEEIQNNFLIIANVTVEDSLRVVDGSIMDLPSKQFHDLLKIQGITANRSVVLSHELSLMTPKDNGYFRYVHLFDESNKQLMQEMINDDLIIILYKPLI